ncbi:hypothetical protein, partial [Escherichia coli]|uniref:hypothetical protein n=1 Tax=Escherichia coli TaxID=562 RepID=UPI001CCADDE9
MQVLTNESMTIASEEGEQIVISGIEDPLSSNLVEETYVEQVIDYALKDVQDDLFKILLSHRPEQFNVY